MTIKNLTPHDVNVVCENGKTVTFPPEGIIPRCTQSSEKIGEVTVGDDTVDIVKSVFGQVNDLPEREKDTIFIVSMVVAKAASDRDDLVIPTDLVRNEAGAIIGCKALAKI